MIKAKKDSDYIVTIKCPLCTNYALYEELKDNKGSSHAWICEACPFVAFEFWQDVDAKRMLDRLLNDKA